jgi:preprotein translocase subunit SecA
VNLFASYFKLTSKKILARADKIAKETLGLESWAQSLSDEQLRGEFQNLRSAEIAQRYSKGFALVREAARRSVGLAHYRVQLLAGLVLLDGKLAEMKTGEGKTLTITAPAAVLALEGKGVHVVTANEYLARRDAESMRPIYEKLGLTVSFLTSAQTTEEKKQAYACDVTYGVGSEFGFDYLRDQMAYSLDAQVQRGHFAAIVDEVDTILIDEARTPLIISGPAADASGIVLTMDACVRLMRANEHFTVKLKEREVQLLEAGYHLAEEFLVGKGLLEKGSDLYAPARLAWVNRLHAALKAHVLFRRDKDYVVHNGEVLLIDEGTGRKMEGRRLQDGIHEALEAKEAVAISRGTVTRALTTYQNYFGKYERLAGLTGTAMTEAEEFSEIYNLDTVVIPTNRPVQRIHHEDLVYLTKAQKFQAAVALAVERSNRGQPVLVGCGSVRDAEVLDRMFTKAGIAHETLTAKFIEREAHIIANAGLPGAITIATNMAGRGTDIVLGGEKPESADEAALQAWRQRHEQVRKAGGLFVLGTERSGIRRIDNQLAGRAGRQGDPGEVQFLLSLEDDLLKAFGRAKSLEMERAYLRASQGALGGSMVKKLIDSAQKSVESEGFAARKSLMMLDKVQAEQRDAIYALRRELLTKGAGFYAKNVLHEAIQNWLELNMPRDSLPESWDVLALRKDIQDLFGVEVPLLRWSELCETDEIRERVSKSLLEWADKRLDALGEQVTPLVLSVLDELWVEHLQALEELRQNFQFKTKTGFNPVFQYGKDAFELFTAFEKGLAAALAHRILVESLQSDTAAVAGALTIQAAAPTPWVITPEQKVALALEKAWVRRNDPCPCESGKRFKECHGKLTR